MKKIYLPGTFRERLINLMKYHKKAPTDLSKQIDNSESPLNRFFSG